MYFEKYGRRHWAVYDEQGVLIAVTVYKKGAREVIERLTRALSESRYAADRTANTNQLMVTLPQAA